MNNSESERLKREVARLKYGAVNNDFVQVSRKQIDKLNELAASSRKAHYLLWFLVKAMNRQNAFVTSQENLIKLSGLTRPTLQRAIAVLREQNWIQVLKVGTTNSYRINSAVFWRDRAQSKWASYSAEVIVSMDEQDDITRATPTPDLHQVPYIDQPDDVVVTGTQLGSDDPPEQSQLDFHRNPLIDGDEEVESDPLEDL